MLRHPEVVQLLGDARLRHIALLNLRREAPLARISDSVMTFGLKDGLLEVGAGVQIREGTVLAFGDETNGHGRIHIGKNSWVGQYNNLRAGGGDIVIGDDCLISQFCTLVGANHRVERSRPIHCQGSDTNDAGVRLGNDVWLGAGCVVMPGVYINDGAVVGANSVVTCSVPAYEIWAGAPARKIGQRQ